MWKPATAAQGEGGGAILGTLCLTVNFEISENLWGTGLQAQTLCLPGSSRGWLSLGKSMSHMRKRKMAQEVDLSDCNIYIYIHICMYVCMYAVRLGSGLLWPF